jgi:OmpA family
LFTEPPGEPETVPGTTAVGTSARVLKALKAGGNTDFTVYLTVYDAYPLTSADANAGGPFDTRFKGTLHRVESGTVGVPVIVKGRLVNLPAIHVKGTLLDLDAEFWFLDDVENPLALRFTLDKDTLKVIRINFPGESASMPGTDGSSGIEQSLSQTGHAVTYGIYFGFNSDLIRTESEPVLREIASAMTKHPDWNLDVNGHTDNIGGTAFNQALSARRAESVKKALVQRYHIGADRFQTAGYGLSQPKATNDTLEGRALNRRVELVKH